MGCVNEPLLLVKQALTGAEWSWLCGHRLSVQPRHPMGVHSGTYGAWVTGQRTATRVL